jgi:hypothetical protein
LIYYIVVVRENICIVGENPFEMEKWKHFR